MQRYRCYLNSAGVFPDGGGQFVMYAAAEKEINALHAELTDVRAQAAADRAEIASCLENIRELTAQRRTRDAVIADVRAELHIGPGVSVVEEAGHVYMQLAADRAALHNLEIEREAQRKIWLELRALFGAAPNESLTAVCNKAVYDLAQSRAALEQARALAHELCLKIETLQASELQTEISVMASSLAAALDQGVVL